MMRRPTTLSLTMLSMIIAIIALWSTASTSHAQHLIRNFAAISSTLIPLKQIDSVEILPTSSTTIANSYFTIPEGGLVYAVTFLFDMRLPQVPFICGATTSRPMCRAARCFLSCGGPTTNYNVALRCNSGDSSSSTGGMRILALSQDAIQETQDDTESITLKVNQRILAGTKCQFVFANDVFGRPFVVGGLHGSVVLTMARTFPFGSGMQFHPTPTRWNKTLLPTSSSTTTTIPSGAYVRCSSSGAVSFLQTPLATSDTATSYWTAACCFNTANNNKGDCTVSYSDIPSFYYNDYGVVVSSSSAASQRRKTVWARIDNKTSTSATLEAACASIISSNNNITARSLRVNTSILDLVLTSPQQALANSLFTVIQMAAAPNSATISARDTSAVGIFTCVDRVNPSREFICAAFASNRSFVGFPAHTNFSGVVVSSSSNLIPICETFLKTTSSTSSTQQDQLLGHYTDDASSSFLASTATSNYADARPIGPCYNVKTKILCTSPCVWSDTFGVCLWGDTAAATSSSSQSSSVLHRSAACTWPNGTTTTSSTTSAAVLLPDLRCRLASSELSLAALLAQLCLLRGLTAADVGWCVQSAFTCSQTPEVVVDNLMSFFCSPTFSTINKCADPSLSCMPNGTTAAPPPPPAFVLSVTTNTSRIDVGSEIRVSKHGFVSIAILLVATGAYFNLSAIRNDLALGYGFEPVVPAGSSNYGRFSVKSEFSKLFSDPDFAITDVLGVNSSTMLAQSLVIRIKGTVSLQPLPGTEQYIDIVPQTATSSSLVVVATSDPASSSSSPSSSSSSSSSTNPTTTVVAVRRYPWMTPTDFTFARVRIIFSEGAADACSLTGLAAAAVIFGILSGWGGWLIVAAVQATLLGAHSSCAPDPVRRCFDDTLGLVSPARWFWPTTNDTTDDRRIFWTQFLVIVVALVLHIVVLRAYQYCAPLSGSGEQKVWFPAPGFYLAGLLCVGTVQAAWIVIFNDSQAALRVVSFFCFAAIVGVILPWMFLKLFRQQENFFLQYDFSGLFRQMEDDNNRKKKRNNNADDEDDDNNSNERKRQRKRDDSTDDHDASSGRKNARKDGDSPTQSKKKRNNSKEKKKKPDDDHASLSPSMAETAHISLHRNRQMTEQRKLSEKNWNSVGERINFWLFSLFLPMGGWPHTRGMLPVRDLVHHKAQYFPWTSLVLLGFMGLNFSYLGVDQELCAANYGNMAALQGLWIAVGLWWRPFRVPILTFLWTIARILDFAAAILGAEWIRGATPDPDKAQTIVRVKTVSLTFMLIFAIIMFIAKLKEALSALAEESGAEIELKNDERRLDIALHKMKLEQHGFADGDDDEAAVAWLALHNSNSKSNNSSIGGSGLFKNGTRRTDGNDGGGGNQRVPVVSHSAPENSANDVSVTAIVPLRAPPPAAESSSSSLQQHKSRAMFDSAQQQQEEQRIKKQELRSFAIPSSVSLISATSPSGSVIRLSGANPNDDEATRKRGKNHQKLPTFTTANMLATSHEHQHPHHHHHQHPYHHDADLSGIADEQNEEEHERQRQRNKVEQDAQQRFRQRMLSRQMLQRQREEEVELMLTSAAANNSLAGSTFFPPASHNTNKQRPTQQQTGGAHVEIRWEDDNSDFSSPSPSPERRTQKAANMLSSFGSLVRVSELTTPLPSASASTTTRHHRHHHHEDDYSDDDDDSNQSDDEDRHNHHDNPLRVVATFSDVRDAVAAVRGLSGKTDESGTRIQCELLSSDGGRAATGSSGGTHSRGSGRREGQLNRHDGGGNDGGERQPGILSALWATL